MRIGWYARDGYVDFFPLLARRLEDMGIGVSSYFACNDPAEERRLRTTHGRTEIWVLSRYLRHNWGRWDVCDGAMAELASRYRARALAECLWAERCVLRPRDDVLRRRLVGHLAFWEDFFESSGADVLVSEQPSILSGCAAWLVCKRRGIEFLAFSEVAPLGTRAVVTTSWEGHYDGLEDALSGQTALSSESRRLARAYLDTIAHEGLKKARRNIMYIAKERSEGVVFAGLPRSMNGLLDLIRRVRQERDYYLRPSVSQRLARRLFVGIKKSVLPKTGIFEGGDMHHDRYFLFPLHQPREWSNYVCFGLEFGDPVGVVRRIAACLPPGTWLYVKEHTAEFGSRSLRQCLALRRIPRVKLIDPYHDTVRLLQHTRAVVTLGSTMGFEALLIGKPAILLSRPWYHRYPGAYYAASNQELAQLLQQAERLPVPDRAALEQGLAALYDISFEGEMYPPEALLAPENIGRFARALAERLRVRRATPMASRSCDAAPAE